MEPNTGCDIEFEIGVVHPVQAPQRRHSMKQYVLKIDREIEHGHSDDHSNPRRQPEAVKQAPTALFPAERQAEDSRREQKTQDDRVSDQDAEIVGPTAPSHDRPRAPPRPDFPSRHRGEYTRGNPKPDPPLA